MNKLIIILLLPLVFAACDDTPAPIPITEVVVDQPELREYSPSTTFVGHLHATDDVDIQARVSGYLKSKDFIEGDLVGEGAILFRIDDSQYKAALKQAQANVARARANQAVAERNYNRGQELLPKGAISQSEMDKLLALKLEADADIKGAEAQEIAAEVDLSYTTIRAPFTGRIDRSEFSPGDLIGPNSGALTTLVSIDPMQALFSVSESMYLSSKKLRDQRASNGQSSDISEIKVKLELTNREIYPATGHIDFISNRINEATGTLEARASIPNKSGLLRPGQYVRVMLEMPYTVKAILVPQSAIQADQQGNFVLAVNPAHIVERHNVILGDRLEDKVVVSQGVDVGMRIVVRGLQRIRPGQTVTAKEMPPLNTSDSN